AVRARGGMLSERRRALPLYPGEVKDERTCPLLDRSGGCSVYDARPLGCRTFWCERAESDDRPVARETVAAFVRRIQDLATGHERDGERGRPLTRALADDR
ncbi:MAG: YkgJ family cysteine cluster protein, partial [Deltaproteobacteria bacterium]|nr:YkgJ family cysteine cluster protein [Deltaproteobacteria bacterium]